MDRHIKVILPENDAHQVTFACTKGLDSLLSNRNGLSSLFHGSLWATAEITMQFIPSR